ncbi:uncharacterized protein LOC129950355 [Eupeodes corollae]|uniref:uncharacterized protein LOC129950355 n=1 Tax=Eupeodes corollae TaxID=290404 RepID=UPI00249254F8|nr:uncharacterized protein LOC129950355 [Eupeodes corollae]
MITDGEENEFEQEEHLEDDASDDCMEFQIGLMIEPESQEISIVTEKGRTTLPHFTVAPIQNALKRKLDNQKAHTSKSYNFSSASETTIIQPSKISKINSPNVSLDTATVLSAIDDLRKLMTQIAAKTDKLYEDFQEIKNKQSTWQETTILDRTNLGTPFGTKEDLAAFEEKIKNDDIPRKLFKHFLLNVDDQTWEKYISKCLFACFKKELAVLCSFYGKNKNIEIQNLEMIKILRECVHEKFSKVRVADTNHVIKKWFHLATDRYRRIAKDK